MELQQHAFFSFLDEESTAAIMEGTALETLREGSVIFNENDPAEDMYLVFGGAVRILKKDAAGEDRLLAVIGENDYFGEFAVFDGQPRSAGAISAAGETVLARIKGARIRSIFGDEQKRGGLKLILHMIRKVRENNQRIVDEMVCKQRMMVLGQMAGTVIHDLKAPATGILFALSLIEDEGITDKQKEYGAVIKAQVERMKTMVNDVLDFSRGAPRLNRQPVDLDAICRRLDELNREMFLKAGVGLNIDACRATVNADENKILRALQNLISNAFEVLAGSDAKGEVKVRCACEEGQLRISVHDNGPGIPEEMRPYIFEPFATMGKSKGTGLGMVISKSIIEAHGGELSFKTDREKGTEFLIRLPLG